MGILDKSQAELNTMTKVQIMTLISSEQVAKKAEERITITKSQSGDKRGQTEHTFETRDGNGNLIGTVQTTWTYWGNGNVRDITTTEKDVAGKVIDTRVVKHGEGGGLVVEAKEVEEKIAG